MKYFISDYTLVCIDGKIQQKKELLPASTLSEALVAAVEYSDILLIEEDDNGKVLREIEISIYDKS